MKTIIRNTEQMQAILNGATQFSMPLEGTFKIEREEDYFTMIIENMPNVNLESVGNFSTQKKAISYLIRKYAPYQIGDEIFVKQTFCDCWGDENILRITNVRAEKLFVFDFEIVKG